MSDAVSSSSPRWREVRLLPAALGAWGAGGILIGVDPGAPLAAVAGALWASAALTLLVALRAPGFAFISVAAAAAALVASVVAVQAPLRSPAGFPDASDGAVALEFTVSGAPDDGRVQVRARAVDRPEAGEASVLLFLDEPAALRIGERASASAVLRTVPPGDDVAFLAFVRGPVTLLGAAPPGLAFAASLREGLSAVSATLPGQGAQLLPGLAVGDTSRVGEQLDADMKTSSLSHI